MRWRRPISRSVSRRQTSRFKRSAEFRGDLRWENFGNASAQCENCGTEAGETREHSGIQPSGSLLSVGDTKTVFNMINDLVGGPKTHRTHSKGGRGRFEIHRR